MKLIPRFGIPYREVFDQERIIGRILALNGLLAGLTDVRFPSAIVQLRLYNSAMKTLPRIGGGANRININTSMCRHAHKQQRRNSESG